MPPTPYPRQPVRRTAIPNHHSSTQTYGATGVERYGTQGFEGLANIAHAQYHELEESRRAYQMLKDDELGAWSGDYNAVSDGREGNAQSTATTAAFIQDFYALELNPWDTAASQSLYRGAHPDPAATALQHDRQGQDYSSSSTASSAPQNGPALVPLYSPQTFQIAPQASSLSPGSDTIGLDEHDLRRLRNTAASARFRVKKRLREENLHRTTQQKREVLAALETRVFELEMENKWLKGLLMERYDTDDIEALRESFKNKLDAESENKEEATGDDQLVTEK